MTLASEFSAPFAIAPAGSPLVFEAIEGGTRRLYVRELSDPALRRARWNRRRAAAVLLARRSAGWRSSRTASSRRCQSAAGRSCELADIGGNPRGAAWTPDGTIIVAPTQTSGLVRVPDRGGKPEPLTTLDKARGEYSHRWPDVLPGGTWVLFTVGLEDATFDEGRIEAVSLETGERRLLVTGAGFARYVPSGRLLFVRGGQLHAVDFDADGLAVRGTPEVVLDARPLRLA